MAFEFWPRPAELSKVWHNSFPSIIPDQTLGCRRGSRVISEETQTEDVMIEIIRRPAALDCESPVQAWLSNFAAACASGDTNRLATLFEDESYWRDLLAFTGRIETLAGARRIGDALARLAPPLDLAGMEIDRARTPPRCVVRAGAECIEAIIRFRSCRGRGAGVLRLKGDGSAGKAWTLLTTLEELATDAVSNAAGDAAKSHARDFRGPNWSDLRSANAAYSDRDPAVLVVGAGQAGLAIGARLTALGIDTLVVDRVRRIGDNWRNRYHALTLHNQTHVNHLPFMPFPPTWPSYIPKDKLAGWLEAYAEAMELNCWTATSFEAGHYNEAAGCWTVTLRRADGTVRQMHPRHIVLATGVSGIPNIPDIPTLPAFEGLVLHASQYQDGEAWAGKRAIVLGSGNSAHDIAQDLHSGGADVTLVQRSPTMVVDLETAQLPYALYNEGISTEDCDLITAGTPLPLARKTHQHITAMGRARDRALLDGLTARGFRLDFGDDDTGWQFKYLTRGGGYYFNVGCSDLIVSGEVKLLSHDAVTRFTRTGLELTDGRNLAADLIVLATGYKGQTHLLQKLFGADVAERVGPVWGFGDGFELRNMYTRTPQQGLWFIAGSLAQCRIYSKYLALQIKAQEAAIGGKKTAC